MLENYGKKKVVILVDLQNDFIDGSLGSDEAKAIVPNVIKYLNTLDSSVVSEIILTRDTHPENYMDTREGRFLPVSHCIKDSHGWQVNKSIEAASESVNTKVTYIDKPTFGSIDLLNYLKDNCYKYSPHIEVDILGLCTDICVISNALMIKALFNESEVNLISNCCAGVSKELHEAAIKVMKSNQINIVGQ